MRLVLAVVVVSLLAVPASAANVNPKLLVLQQADVPKGFGLDRDDSGLRSNEREAKNDRRLRSLMRRWQRITGYQAGYDRREVSITSRADLCLRPEGADRMLAFVVREMEKAGVRGLRRSPMRIGTKGWVYGGASASSTFDLVYWRHGRVFAGVGVWGLAKPQTLALARAQERRIATVVG